jgi:RNA polymerase sigma-70 factor, ECF subfamily
MDSRVVISEQGKEAARTARFEREIAWMTALKERSETAFVSLYREYGGQVLAVCLRILQDRHTAEDVLSEVFWEIWKEPQRYDSSRSTPLTYLLMVARSRAIDRLREVSRRAKVMVDAAAAGQMRDMSAPKESPEARFDSQEEGHILRSALEGLDASQRQVLEMAFFAGMSHQQIAAQLDHPLGTVKSRIRQGLLHLRQKLAPSFAERHRP